jgi:aspartyl-tRNA(Asn)/glutamyl-tRNA(Gln) amidotransferase subunit B
MAQSLSFASYYEEAREMSGQAKLVANWLMGDVSANLNRDGIDISVCPVGATTLAGIVRRVHDGTISNKAGRELLAQKWNSNVEQIRDIARALDDIDALIAAQGLAQLNDGSALEKIVDDVLAANAKSVDEFRAGKDKAFNALVGQVMKASKGQANPAQASDLLKKKLGPS